MPDFLPDHGQTGRPMNSHGDGKIIDSEVWLAKSFEKDPREGCALLYRSYYAPLFSHALRFVYSRAAAEDIVAEIFCRFWEDRIFQKINTSYRAYLFKAVRHAAYNHVKFEFAKKNKLQYFPTGESPSGGDEILQYDELHQLLEGTIDRLPPQCKKVFVSSRVESKKYQDIAAELGISVKAIERHISKALRILRDKLNNEWNWH